MKKISNIFCILCFIISRKVKSQQMQKKICAVCEEGPVTDRMCHKWFEKFHTGDFLLDDAPRSGRSVEGDSDPIKTLIVPRRR